MGEGNLEDLRDTDHGRRIKWGEVKYTDVWQTLAECGRGKHWHINGIKGFSSVEVCDDSKISGAALLWPPGEVLESKTELALEMLLEYTGEKEDGIDFGELVNVIEELMGGTGDRDTLEDYLRNKLGTEDRGNGPVSEGWTTKVESNRVMGSRPMRLANGLSWKLDDPREWREAAARLEPKAGSGMETGRNPRGGSSAIWAGMGWGARADASRLARSCTILPDVEVAVREGGLRRLWMQRSTSTQRECARNRRTWKPNREKMETLQLGGWASWVTA